MIGEVAMWIGRVARLLPELMGLWEAAKAPDPASHLEAALALVRKMKDEQMREEINIAAMELDDP